MSSTTHTLPGPSAEAFMANHASDHKKKRERTGGEKLFDWSVYGGIGWIVNAALSLKAADWLEQTEKGKKLAAPMTRALEKVLEPFSFIKDPKKAAGTTVFIAVLYTGGTMLVPVMKWFEDRKGTLVRFADRILHGKDAETNPDIIQAHKEMDEAPQQSWGSMLNARVLSFPAGLAISKLVGSHDALSAKLATDGSTASKFASFERAGATIGRGIAENVIKPNPAPIGKVARAIEGLKRWTAKRMLPAGMSTETWLAGVSNARRATPHTTTVGGDHRAVRNLSNTVYELLLSSFVAFGFYVTSHAFAALKDKKEHERNEHSEKKSRQPVSTYLPATTAPEMLVEPATAKQAGKPATQVSHVSRQQHQANVAEAMQL